MKKTVLIIEDDAEQQSMLEHLVKATSEDTIIYTAANTVEAYKILMENTIDVFLVDIILDTKRPGDTSGVLLVEKLRTIPKYMFTPVIFITSLEDPTMYAYTDLNCLGYIEKPYDIGRVKKMVERALNYTTYRKEEVSLSFRRDGILYPVKVKDIVYMESIRHIMYIHLANGSCLEIPYKTCKQVLTEADTQCLVQCSRNTLVNKEYIQSVDIPNKYIILKNKMGMVDIGVTFKKKVLMEFGNG